MRAIACVSRWGCRSFRVAREASRGVPASWWVICARVAVCGPVVASRHPGDLKNATNPRRIHLGHTHVSFELRGADFQKISVGTKFHKILLPALKRIISPAPTESPAGAFLVTKRPDSDPF